MPYTCVCVYYVNNIIQIFGHTIQNVTPKRWAYVCVCVQAMPAGPTFCLARTQIRRRMVYIYYIRALNNNTTYCQHTDTTATCTLNITFKVRAHYRKKKHSTYYNIYIQRAQLVCSSSETPRREAIARRTFAPCRRSLRWDTIVAGSNNSAWLRS